MKAKILNHPLIEHKLAILRDKKTGTKETEKTADRFCCHRRIFP